MPPEIEALKQTIIPILKRHDVSRAGLFGSYATNEYTAESDVDILVQLGKKISLLDFVGIKFDLEDTLNKKVDLVEYQAIKPRLRDRILAQEIRLYG